VTHALSARPALTALIVAGCLSQVLMASLGPRAERAASRSSAAPDNGWYTAAQAERGQAAYRDRCANCHGRDFVPDDFSTGLKGAAFEWRWNGRTVADLFEVTRRTMPPGEAGSLGPRATSDILAYLLQTNGYPEGPSELPSDAEALKAMKLTRTSKR
jgi:mono/diheme cytochrome c family protein